MQVVGYRARTNEPAALRIADGGTVRDEWLEPGDELAYSLGDRHCAGTVDYSDAHGDTDGDESDDVHLPCDAEKAPYCDVHTSRWPCARCTGNCDMPIDNCHEEHAIYLAAFAPDVFKVGVTKPWRLERRLREQGADRAAHLRTVANGRVAREIEAEIATDVGDRVRVPTKMQGFHEPVDDGAWADLLAEYDYETTFEFDYGLGLADRPMPETIATGTVVGAKGRVVILENGGTTYAVDLRDLVGYEVEDEGSDRELQSSLGAFS
ncbi:Protein of unknown function [Halomicrobium zhouii]|uniref:DUF2797 domain-containing protein n=1 Tax=Halomicrobium zhouii TaxID=767519 RepID=A0A1I6LV20_9EURY|nr:DUF2797 domain-containing protein [Halomicrobium zhouii]SFS07341.1 Protein of unknown function [Halomicrobium zhouii]